MILVGVRRQDNINPVDGVERSSLILASTVHGRPAADLIRPEHVPAALGRTPALFMGLAEDPTGVWIALDWSCLAHWLMTFNWPHLPALLVLTFSEDPYCWHCLCGAQGTCKSLHRPNWSRARFCLETQMYSSINQGTWPEYPGYTAKYHTCDSIAQHCVWDGLACTVLFISNKGIAI